MMSFVAKRMSLVVQVRDILRHELTRGKWVDHLPGERSLCDSLQVSRSTLHKALNILERDGWLEVVHGRRTRILRSFRKRTRTATSRIVGALLPEPLSAQNFSNLYQITQLQHYLQKAGLQLDVYFDARLRTQRALKRLETLVHRSGAGCWVLFSMSRTVQHWFKTQQVPCLVDGFPYQGILLPSIDVDHVATCRHAVGKLLSVGHRRVAFLTLRTGFAGDLASEQAFVEAVRKSPHPDDGQADQGIHS